MSENTYIKSVAEYIEKVSKISTDGSRYVYRGEQQRYDSSCFPNIFRDKSLNNPNFEKNIIEKIRASGLDKESSYLLTAIEAQHGGFPSRLLDVSYNCLIALHFAVTPFYTNDQDSKDNEDGIVYIIKVEDMYFPSSGDIENFYVNHLLRSESLFNTLPIFSHHFKMLDFYSKNARIKAQQGGFILFCGSSFRPLPKYLISEIVISKRHKKKIRKELSALFNISNAFIYPESNNIAAPFLSEITNYTYSTKISAENEIKEISIRLHKDTENYINKFILLINDNKELCKQVDLVKDFERMLRSIYIDIDRSIEILNTKKKNKRVISSIENLEKEIIDIHTKFSDYLELASSEIQISTIEQIKKGV